LADVAVDPLVVETQAVKNLARACFERVAAEMVVLLLHVAEARQDPVHVVCARRIGHRLLQMLELVVQFAEASAAGDRFVEHGSAGHLLDVLPEIADGQLLGNRHVALVRLFFAGDHAEQGRLAGSVRTDEADLFVGVQLKRGVDEENLATVLFADSVERDHLLGRYSGYVVSRPPRSASSGMPNSFAASFSHLFVPGRWCGTYPRSRPGISSTDSEMTPVSCCCLFSCQLVLRMNGSSRYTGSSTMLTMVRTSP